MSSVHNYGSNYFAANFSEGAQFSQVNLKQGIKLGLDKKLLSQEALTSEHSFDLSETQARKLLCHLDNLVRLNSEDPILPFQIGNFLDDLLQSDRKVKPYRVSTLDPQYQKTMITKHLFELQQTFNILKEPHRYIGKDTICDASGQNWGMAQFSQAGLHTNSINSDARTKKSPYAKNQVYAAFADGVSIYSGSPSSLYTGRVVARESIKQAEELDFTRSEIKFKNLDTKAFDPKQNIKDFIENFVDDSTPAGKILKERIYGLSRGNPRDTLEDVLLGPPGKLASLQFRFFRARKQLISLYRQGPEKVLDSLLEAGYRDTVFAQELMNKINKEVKANFENQFRTYNSFVAGSSTMLLSIDLGDQVALISSGDSSIVPFNKDGLILDKIPSPLSVTASSIRADNGKEPSVEVLSLGTNPRITIVDKKDIEGFALICDGIAKNNHEKLKAAFSNVDFVNDDEVTIAQKLLQSSINGNSGDKSDDKTVIVIKKAA